MTASIMELNYLQKKKKDITYIILPWLNIRFMEKSVYYNITNFNDYLLYNMENKIT